MDQTLTTFIRALRNADIRISTAETLDAFRVTELVGYHDRGLLKQSLSLALAKTSGEKAAFDTCFDRFFAARTGTSLESLDADAMAFDDLGHAPPGGGAAGGEGGGSREPGQAGISDSSNTDPAQGHEHEQPQLDTTSDPASPQRAATSRLALLLLRGNRIEIGVEISAAGRRTGVERIEVFTQKGVYARRILEAMGLNELQTEIASLEASAEPTARRLGHDLSRRRDWLRDEVRGYVEHQFLLHADVTGKRLREDLLKNVRLSALDHRHHRHVQEIVRRMAQKLIASHSRRPRRMRRGQLHVPRTLRRNMKYDDAIVDLQWRAQRLTRPKVFAICDVSGSVAEHARFMLTLLYSLDEILPKVRSFAFSSDFGEISSLFQARAIDDAISLALKQYSGGVTDYGQAFVDFKAHCLDDIDRRTTVIVLGDARNNNGDARLDLLKEIYDRCRRLIWLNPEPRSMWNTGDSEMRHIAAYCHHVEECSTLAHLQRFVAHLVRTQR